MASRNIANMHLFLEMKKKFPDLPEDTLRNYIFLYAQDQDKCFSLLQKESKNHSHSSQLFSDFYISDNKMKFKVNNVKGKPDQEIDSTNSNDILQQHNTSNLKSDDKPDPMVSSSASGRSKSHAGIVSLPLTAENASLPLKPVVQSAPVVSNRDKPVYKSLPASSRTTLCQFPKNDNRMMFSTTKEHTIRPVETSNEVTAIPFPSATDELEESKRHAVSLSITPSFPFPQQQMNVYSNAVCASTSHSSKPGRHTTSLNLQLQPPNTLDPYPVEISTIPTNIGSPCNYRDFGSHLQISVGAQGATFTALRLQRPQNQPATNQLPSSEHGLFHVSPPSSQIQNSKVYNFPIQSSAVRDNSVFVCEKPSPISIDDFSKVISNSEFNPHLPQNNDSQTEKSITSDKLNAQTNFCHGFQASPDYMLAVKNHQLARLEMVQDELNKEKALCTSLKYEVSKLEQEILQTKEKENSSSYIELLKKLKEENRKLRIECNCLVMEYDLCSKGKIPVGMTDEDFYSNIFTGPNDGFTFVSSDGKKILKPKDNLVPGAKVRTSSEEEEEDEKYKWKCLKCSFANHPALEVCEMCELPKNSV